MYGNALGYATHNAQMLKHTLPLIDNDKDAKVVLQVVSADRFVPLEGKVNVLFTMWEFMDVPDNYKKALAEADYVIVPCSFCRDIFAPYCKHKPIVCWEGVDPEKYKFYQRKVDGKFRFLWVGAANPRKGYEIILQVLALADMYPQMEFYIKTTVKKIKLAETIRATLKHWKKIIDVPKGDGLKMLFRIFRRMPSGFNAEKIFTYGKNKNIFVDTRKLSTEALVDIYKSSHAFLFPTLGEGWGLTLTEAMATGLPCIAPSKTGCADYFDNDVGFDIKTNIGDLGKLDTYKMDSCRAHIPDPQDFLNQMVYVVNNYEDALKRGRNASDRVRTQFTWKRSGERLAEILAGIEKREGLNETVTADTHHTCAHIAS